MYLHHIPTYARFQWINHPFMRKLLRSFLKPNPKGRKGYDKVLLFRWLMYKQVMRCSYRDLESMTHIDYSTFIKFRQRLQKRGWFSMVFSSLSTEVATSQTSLTALVDSSFVETYSRHYEEGATYSGYKEKIGFKLHQLIDYVTRLPLMQFVSNGSYADIRGGEILVDRAPPSWRINAFAADKAYDGQCFVHALARKWQGIMIAIPVRKKRGDDGRNRASRSMERTNDPSLYKKRTAIERYFSRKKGVFHCGEERTRGIKNFETNCYMTSIMEILEWR